MAVVVELAKGREHAEIPQYELSGTVSRCIQSMKDVQDGFKQREQTLRAERESFKVEMEMGQLELKTKEEVHKQRVEWEKERLKDDRRSFEVMKRTGAYEGDSGRQHVITIDVGGEKFRTDVRTLERHPDSIFPVVARNMDPHQPSHTPRVRTDVFIDRDSKHFRFILNYMRQGEEVFRGTALRGKDKYDLEEMICEARYYKLNGFMNLLKRHKVRLEAKPSSFANLLTEKLFFAPNLKVPPKYITTRQLLLKERNLAGIVFENVTFTHSVSFELSILDGAKFKQCRFDAAVNFTNADISRISFDHCVNVAPDRFTIDGNFASNCGVTVNPPVDLRQFSINYTHCK